MKFKTKVPCVVHNISTGEDVGSTRNCLEKCGIKSKKDGKGRGRKTNEEDGPVREVPLYCGQEIC